MNEEPFMNETLLELVHIWEVKSAHQLNLRNLLEKVWKIL